MSKSVGFKEIYTQSYPAKSTRVEFGALDSTGFEVPVFLDLGDLGDLEFGV